ncbi:MAG TPA: mandelate racemase/muconate lactonizing enzyme family protein [Candidatus Acidoferrales bacterium]|nr:mandelate racemase/muconate lactonizing enzyme family protein [Candidatus Acidoferrales bacterium]
MKITDIKTIRLRAPIPSERQVRSRRGQRNYRSAVLLEVSTDEGITGVGSCSGNGTLIDVIVQTVLRPLLVGTDPTKIEEVWDKAYFRGGTREFGSRGVGVVALSGLDVALWDILGKVEGLPIYRLLGGAKRDRIPVYATALYPDKIESVLEKARALAASGFRAVKVKVGFDLAQDLEIVRAVRATLGREFQIMTDANQGYTLDAAIEAAGAFADLNVVWLEEPMFMEDIEAHARLRKAVRMPIALGENLHTRFAFEAFMARQAVDYLQPDVARAGGISEILKISELAKNYALPISLHTWGDGVALAASLHLSAALENSPIMELDTTHNPLRTELLVKPLEFEDGFMTPPQGPGLGVELSQEALKKFADASFEEPGLWQKPVASV